jgi:hypothetical protein
MTSLRFPHRSSVASLLALSLLLPPGLAHAQAQPAPDTEQPAPAPAPKPGMSDEAKEKLRAGNEAMERNRHLEALSEYSAGYTMGGAPIFLYNKGRAYEALGDYPLALESMEDFSQKASPELLAKVPALKDLIVDLKKRVGTLQVVCDEKDAEIRLRDAKGTERVVGNTSSPKLVRLNAGTYDLLMSGATYVPVERRGIVVPGGTTTGIPIKMLTKDVAGRLRVSSKVPGAKVSVDGQPIGVVPAELPVAAGVHRILVTMDGYDPAETRTVVNAGEYKPVDIEPKQVPITGKWWFWTTIGVVVAAGAVTAYALRPERDPDSGTIQPGILKTDAAGFRF